MGRVLVVDDDREILSLAGRALSARQHAVMVAADGHGALRAVVEWHPDLVVLDLGLPGLSGSAVLAALCADGTPHRVVLLAARHELPPQLHALAAGAVGHLPKPFVVADLVDLVDRCLAAPVPEPSQADRRRGERLVCGNLQLDLRTRRLSSGSRTAELSGREFELMQHLMSKAGAVCSRAELLREVWGYAFDPGSNVVDVTVARLRAKIYGLGIETVRNVGYLLREA